MNSEYGILSNKYGIDAVHPDVLFRDKLSGMRYAKSMAAQDGSYLRDNLGYNANPLEITPSLGGFTLPYSSSQALSKGTAEKYVPQVQSAGGDTGSWWSKMLGDPNSAQRMNMFRAGSAVAGIAEDAVAAQKKREDDRLARAQWLAANASTMANGRINMDRGYRGLAALGGPA